MMYLTGQHALNIECSLNTCGDWHASSLRWDNITFENSQDRFFKDFGIELSKIKHLSSTPLYVANHIRALLDLLEDGNFALAQGMNAEYICNSKYDNVIFNNVIQMTKLQNWADIDGFMEKEYLMKWVNFKEKEKNGF